MNALLAPFTRVTEHWSMTDDADWHDRYCDTGKHPKPASEDRQRSVTAFIVPALLSTGAELNRVIDRIAGDDAITDEVADQVRIERSAPITSALLSDREPD